MRLEKGRPNKKHGKHRWRTISLKNIHFGPKTITQIIQLWSLKIVLIIFWYKGLFLFLVERGERGVVEFQQ
jgi:hypothetical protein